MDTEYGTLWNALHKLGVSVDYKRLSEAVPIGDKSKREFLWDETGLNKAFKRVKDLTGICGTVLAWINVL